MVTWVKDTEDWRASIKIMRRMLLTYAAMMMSYNSMSEHLLRDIIHLVRLLI